MRISVGVVAMLMALTAVGCGGSTNAPRGAVTDCGSVIERGSVRLDRLAAVHDAECFVAAVHGCHAARMRVTEMGVDSGLTTVFTVRRGSAHACSASVVTTSYVLTKSTSRRQVCRDVSVDSDGLVVGGCQRA